MGCWQGWLPSCSPLWSFLASWQVTYCLSCFTVSDGALVRLGGLLEQTFRGTQWHADVASKNVGLGRCEQAQRKLPWLLRHALHSLLDSIRKSRSLRMRTRDFFAQNSSSFSCHARFATRHTIPVTALRSTTSLAECAPCPGSSGRSCIVRLGVPCAYPWHVAPHGRNKACRIALRGAVRHLAQECPGLPLWPLGPSQRDWFAFRFSDAISGSTN